MIAGVTAAAVCAKVCDVQLGVQGLLSLPTAHASWECNPPQVHRSRFHLTCQVCKQRHGACTQCCEPRCCIGFHPLCARRAGHRMEVGCCMGLCVWPSVLYRVSACWCKAAAD